MTKALQATLRQAGLLRQARGRAIDRTAKVICANWRRWVRRRAGPLLIITILSRGIQR
jgi:hypothetical protein